MKKIPPSQPSPFKGEGIGLESMQSNRANFEMQERRKKISRVARNDGLKKNPPDMYLRILVQIIYIALLAYVATRKRLD